ncbi:MAG: M15 family metallopeptidase [Alistipes sp.]
MTTLCAYSSGCGQTPELQILKEWQAGKSVSEQSVEHFGIANCFQAVAIDNPIFRRIDGKSFKKECTTPRADLRYIKVLHHDLRGQIRLGEMICHQSISEELLEIFQTLYNAKYPIERMVLIDDYDADDQRSMVANNSSAFNFRVIAGTTKLSKHSRGMAVDINPLYNPFVKNNAGKLIVEPQEAMPYVDRKQDFPCKIDTNSLCYKEFIKHGFEWGGSWQSCKDYQHFEK